MTTTAPPTLDLSGTPGIPFGRLFLVELRKTVDTRAGRWLVGITIGAALLAEGIFLAVAATHNDVTASYGDFVAAAAFVSSILLPVVGIMLVTSEWSQRTAMTTFTLEPRRMRIVTAKLLAGVTLTAFVIAFALVVGLVCNVLYGAIQSHQSIDWAFGWSGFAGFVINQTFAMLGGFALASLLLNTPAAIVVFFVYKWVLPALFALGSLMAWFKSISPWLDFQSAQGELYDMPLTGSQWAHLAVSGFLWLVLPLAIGLWRIRRAEVK
jgi:ABC-type transport system involved in multi-copper enzyme maturation permease subunit